SPPSTCSSETVLERLRPLRASVPQSIRAAANANHSRRAKAWAEESDGPGRVSEAPAHAAHAPERAASPERDAFLALVKLGLPRREAKARIAWVLEREPHLGSDAEELLRAALTCSAPAYG